MTSKWHKHIVVVTGIIGSGKSSVVDIFRSHGAFTLSADDLAREAVQKGSKGLELLAKEFSNKIIKNDGSLDRSALSDIVFKDPQRKKLLENITHPIIRDLAAKHFENAFNSNYPLYVYDVPLFFETGMQKLGFRKIILVKAPKEKCIERVMKRSGITREKVEEIYNSQIPLEEKEKLSDIVIDNDSDLENLSLKVSKIFETLKA